jgi:trehalose 6-phosphate phosphatase
MKNVFAPRSVEALKRHLSGKPLLIFDFDGVLAPIIAARDKAKPSPRTRALMDKLTRRARVAVVSGRGLSDVKKRLGFRPRFVLGNHGLEGPPNFQARRRSAKAATAAWSKKLLRFNAADPVPGFDLESKIYSLSIHYHRSERPSASRVKVLSWVETLSPKPRVVLGKRVINLVHPRAATKGDGVRWLLEKAGATKALYVGDDVTDEDVFELRDPRLFGVHVGRKKSAAAYFYSDETETDRFLRLLLDVLE